VVSRFFQTGFDILPPQQLSHPGWFLPPQRLLHLGWFVLLHLYLLSVVPPQRLLYQLVVGVCLRFLLLLQPLVLLFCEPPLPLHQ
jgi:hypothetical protein